jgi:glycosyltransferase involved in cell wall biosynthesis
VSNRVFLLGSSASTLVNFRGPLLKALRNHGCQITAGEPALRENAGLVAWLKREGIEGVDVPVDRTGMNPVADLKLLLNLIRRFRRERPDLLLSYTIKPVIYGTLAAWLAGVPRRFALITGLGYAFIGQPKGRRRWIQRAVRALYRVALARASGVIFQNKDDAALFAELGLLSPQVPVHVVSGSGVNLDHYRPAPQPTDGCPPTFLLVARLLTAKGIREYAAAAAELKREKPEIRCLVVGGHDSNPDAIPKDEFEGWLANGWLEWRGELRDVRPALGECHVFVLPSYREGTPRSVLEAMAVGRAIITTDAPGCRETVVDGENGYLVPVGDSSALATAMRRFLDDPTLASRMGQRSMEVARNKYDVNLVNDAMLQAMAVAA